ncbi:hypothetical protein BDR05DRAFT_431234 [Suillus weaverae]|nr:hypothetical protein BDR05DRAFT_431234 [Suillus weaverae]
MSVLNVLPLINSSTAAPLAGLEEQNQAGRGMDRGDGQADCASCSYRTIRTQGVFRKRAYFLALLFLSDPLVVPAGDSRGLFSTALLTIAYSAMIFVYRALCLQARWAKDFIITRTTTT